MLPRPLALRLLCALCAALAPLCASKPATLTVGTPLSQLDGLAVCNDGSSMQYWFKAATEPRLATVWLAYLQGGEWCWNQTSCQSRQVNAPWEMSSLHWPATRKVGGLFDTDPYRSPLAGSNAAYLGYCSSDAYVGDVAAGESSFGFAFRGAHAVPALILALQRKHGLGSTGGPEQLLLAGCSAGARGVLFTADYAPSWVPHTVTVRVLADSALWLDVPAFNSTGAFSLQQQTAQALLLVNGSGRLSPACAQAYPGSQAWKCLYTQYRLPFIQVPYLLSEAQFDDFQLPQLENAPPPYRGPALEYALAFANTMAEVMSGLPMGDQPYSGVFSSACYQHCVTEESGFYKLAVWPVQNGSATGTGGATEAAQATTLSEALHSWFWDQVSPLHLVEACAAPGTWACGVCRNRTEAQYAQFTALRRAERPPGPPGPSLLGAGGVLTERRSLARFAAVAALATLGVACGASYAKRHGVHRNARGAGFAEDEVPQGWDRWDRGEGDRRLASALAPGSTAGASPFLAGPRLGTFQPGARGALARTVAPPKEHPPTLAHADGRARQKKGRRREACEPDEEAVALVGGGVQPSYGGLKNARAALDSNL